MHYVAIVAGQERQIEISETAPDRYHVLIDGHRFDVDACEVGPSSLSVLLDGRAYMAEMERDGGVYQTSVRGHAMGVEVLDLRRLRLRKAQESAAGPDGPMTVKAPMPGKVVAVLVKEGDEVATDQGLVVVEAMKMENELRAPKAGVVRNLRAVVGSAVESGAALCVIE